MLLFTLLNTGLILCLYYMLYKHILSFLYSMRIVTLYTPTYVLYMTGSAKQDPADQHLCST